MPPAAASPAPAEMPAVVAEPTTDLRVTPMMAQFIEIKAANADCLLFYRMGDFYELFFEDAEIASRALGIVLTRRGKHLGQDIPMCGVPIERGEDALARLIAAGHRVAVCEQVEDPAEARKRGPKTVVRRDVVRLVTPGTLTEERLLDPTQPNLLVALARRRLSDTAWCYGLAALDISTGRFTVSETEDRGLAAELARLDPREIVLPDAVHDDPELKSLWRGTGAALTPLPRDGVDAASAEHRLRAFFGVASLDAFGDFTRTEVAAAGTGLAYVERTQFGQRPNLSPPSRTEGGGVLLIDPSSRASLELVRTTGGDRTGSLLDAIDRTATAAGARLLAERLAGPLTDVAAIRERQEAVARLVEDGALADRLGEALAGLPDMARALARLAVERGGPRDLAALREGLDRAASLAGLLAGAGDLPAELSRHAAALAGLDPALGASLADALVEGPPLSRRDGGFVREGFDSALDELRELGRDSRRVVAALQSRYATETGCRTLRIKHNNQLGYFVEVPAAAGEDLLRGEARGTFMHRQTMAGAMRFTTVELGGLEARIASAGERALAIELSHFEALVAAIRAEARPLARACDALAALDVACGLARLARDGAWTRPRIEEGLAFRIEAGRHPVVEAALRREGQPSSPMAATSGAARMAAAFTS